MGNRDTVTQTGERNLMLAVLSDGINCFQKHARSTTKAGENRFREVNEWIESRSRVWIYSFENICETLELDPSYLRAGLRAWREENAENRDEAVLASRKKREMDHCSGCGQRRWVKKRTEEGKPVCGYCESAERGEPNPKYILCPRCGLGPRFINYPDPEIGEKVCQGCYNRVRQSPREKSHGHASLA